MTKAKDPEKNTEDKELQAPVLDPSDSVVKAAINKYKICRFISMKTSAHTYTYRSPVERRLPGGGIEIPSNPTDRNSAIHVKFKNGSVEVPLTGKHESGTTWLNILGLGTGFVKAGSGMLNSKGFGKLFGPDPSDPFWHAIGLFVDGKPQFELDRSMINKFQKDGARAAMEMSK